MVTAVVAVALLGAAGAPHPEACGLIPRQRIQDVQADPVREATATTEVRGPFVVSQCFYATESFARSVSLAVTWKNPQDASGFGPRDYWRQRFQEGGDADVERESGPPRPVPGIGDEAFWSGSGRAGALYVLSGDAVLRLSVGGVRDEETRIERTSALAKEALARLTSASADAHEVVSEAGR